MTAVVPAAKALARLREGNGRFVEGDRSIDTYLSHTKLDQHLEGQSPFAVILGCSDSRVPVEIVFDAGIGDLFVIRVAGNIVAPSLVGSVELAADKFGSRLVVVMGHTACGAIQATLDTISEAEADNSSNVNAIVDFIRPCFDGMLDAGLDRDEIVARAVRQNVTTTAAKLRHGSAVLERLIRDEGLLVVGAEYSLETGVVEFFDGVPA